MVKNIFVLISCFLWFPSLCCSSEGIPGSSAISSYDKPFKVYSEMSTVYVQVQGGDPRLFSSFLQEIGRDSANNTGEALGLIIPDTTGKQTVKLKAHWDVASQQVVCAVHVGKEYSRVLSTIAQTQPNISGAPDLESNWSLRVNLSTAYNALFTIMRCLAGEAVISKAAYASFAAYFRERPDSPSFQALNKFTNAHLMRPLVDQCFLPCCFPELTKIFCEQYEKPIVALGSLIHTLGSRQRGAHMSSPSAPQVLMLKTLIAMVPGNLMNPSFIPASFQRADLTELKGIYAQISGFLKDLYSLADFGGPGGDRLVSFFQYIDFVLGRKGLTAYLERAIMPVSERQELPSQRSGVPPSVREVAPPSFEARISPKEAVRPVGSAPSRAAKLELVRAPTTGDRARDYMSRLPQTNQAKSVSSLAELRASMALSHFGLNDAKERVVGKLAQEMHTGFPDGKGILVVGSAMTGKKTLAQQIASALGRKFISTDLRTLREESDVIGLNTGHPAADVGFVIKSLIDVSVQNPVWLLEGADTVSPEVAEALRQAIDPARNKKFKDRFLQDSVDLSQVLFIATATDYSGVPSLFHDCCEGLVLPAYTGFEKRGIAQRLLPKQFRAFNLTFQDLEITPQAVKTILERYDFDSGLGMFSKAIESIMRKAIVQRMEHGVSKVSVTADNLETFLGISPLSCCKADLAHKVGEVKWLYVTGNTGGADTLYAVPFSGPQGHLEISGQVAQDTAGSFMAARAYLLSQLMRADQSLVSKLLSGCKPEALHVGFEQNGRSISGSSAGLASAMCILSALTHVPAYGDVAMTGAISPTGAVTAVGGIPHKVLGAKLAGIKKVLIPAANMADLDPVFVQENGIEVVPVRTVEEAIPHVLIHQRPLFLGK